MPNVDLLTRTLAHIEANPEEWDQRAWSSKAACGTAYCFAGHAIMLTRPNALIPFRSGSVILHPGSLAERDEDVSDYAGMLLGLDEVDSDVLFDPNNDLDDLRRMVGNLVAGREIDAEDGAS